MSLPTGGHNSHNHTSVRNNWALVMLYVAFTVIAVFAFQKGCNRNPYQVCTFTRYSFNEAEVKKDNVIRLYDEDSVLYINDDRYKLQRVQQQLLDRQSDYILGQYYCFTPSLTNLDETDTAYIGIEFKHGYVISITVEKNDTSAIDGSNLESYYN